MRRALVIVFVFCTSVIVTGCESNNKGKIVGRWKAIKLPGIPQGANEEYYSVITFNEDGTMNWWLLTHYNNVTIEGRYSLGYKDRVTFHLDKPLKGRKRHSERIRIAGDVLTMVDSDGTSATFRREPE